jgi:hypothetical protein
MLAFFIIVVVVVVITLYSLGAPSSPRLHKKNRVRRGEKVNVENV